MLSKEAPKSVSGLSSSASEITLHLLSRLGAVGDDLRVIVEKGCLRNLDVRTIVSEPLIGDEFDERETIVRAMERPLSSAFIDRTIEKIEEDGFAPHFHELFAAFGSILLEICGNEDQRRSVASWSTLSQGGAFLMTDQGGPSLANWLSCVEGEAGSAHLTVKKVDAIDAATARFAIVAARRGRARLPSLFLLSPEQFGQLRREPVGRPWLDGSFQLAHVEGRVNLCADAVLGAGGFTAVNMFLTIVRPRFVRALMAYLDWLESSRRLLRSEHQRHATGNLQALARTASFRDLYSGLSIDEISAVKFASNELILDIVASASVVDAGDRRDLLGFTKMEGSSYRCLFEILEKRRKRHGKSVTQICRS